MLFRSLAGLAMLILVPVLGFSPQATKGAWTHPVSLGQGARHYGFQSTLVGDRILVITTAFRTGDTVSIKADEFTTDGSPIRVGAMQVEIPDLMNYSLTSNSSQYLIVWAEVLFTTSRLYMQSSIDKEKVLIRETESYIKSVTASLDEFGRLAIAWTDNSKGLQGVYVSLQDINTGVKFEDVHMSSPGRLSLDPVVAWSDDVLHVIYKEQDHIFTNIVHRAMSVSTMDISDGITVRRTNVETVETPVCIPAVQGGLDMYWPADVQSRGLAQIGRASCRERV